ncbi:hypothetical protein [Kineococcus xinjiangensis]|nr:hypothetical protein [Kineococcus xinjiangensis]
MGSSAGAQDEAGATVAVVGIARADAQVPRGPAGEAAARESVRLELRQLALPALRSRRRALLAEAESTAHWLRLVRARRDLVLAFVTGVDELRVPLEAASDGGPLDLHAVADLAAHGLTEPSAGLRDLVLPGLAADPGPGAVEQALRRLTAAQRRLGDYERALREELAAATEVLVEHHCGALADR